MAELRDLEHLLVLFAEDVPVTSLAALPEHVTTCRQYHLTPEGEERAERIWPSFDIALREAGVTCHLRASMPDTFGDVTVIEASAEVVESVLAGLDDLPPATLLAVALQGGEATPVEESWGGLGALGAPGTLLLHTPWTSQGWVSDEICDHTSLIQLCERWVATRGGDVRRVWLPAWRRRVCGDLLGALDLGEPVAREPGVRPLPYAPEAEIVVEDGTPVLHLANPGAARAVHLRVDDGTGPAGHTVPADPLSRSRHLTVPLAVHDGRYDVTVTGPGGFARHFSATLVDIPQPEGSTR